MAAHACVSPRAHQVMGPRRLVTAGAVVALAGTLLSAQTQPPAASSPHPPVSGQGARASRSTGSPALSEITDRGLRADTRFLSHDLLEGRAPSTRGGQLAAEYIATRFAMLGLKPGAGNDSYFQPITIVEAKVDPSATLTFRGASGNAETLKFSTDMVAFSGTQQPDVAIDADAIFVGYGINSPEQQWNDYAGVDVHGKVVLVMVNDPPAPPEEPTLFGGKALTYYGRWTYKFEEAARQGAAGAILIHTTESATYPWQVVQSSWSGTQYSLPATPGEQIG